jgi:hypothetical protein
MTTGHTTEECLDTEHENDHEATEATAERHGRTLADVQHLLKARGIHAYTVHTVGLKLFGDGRPYPLGKRERQAPELVAYCDTGWAVATVTVGRRSGCYLVSVRDSTKLQVVRNPQQVVDLILSACPKVAA